MADYTSITDSQCDPDAPLTSGLAYAWRDNPIAMFDGAVGAPRLRIGALQRLAAGTQIRSRIDATQAKSNSTFEEVYGFSFLQSGTVRISFERRRTTASTVEASLVRIRGESSSSLNNWSYASTTFGSVTFDASILPGDHLSLQTRGDLGTFGYEVRNIRLSTNGQDLYPGSMFPIEGNTYN